MVITIHRWLSTTHDRFHLNNRFRMLSLVSLRLTMATPLSGILSCGLIVAIVVNRATLFLFISVMIVNWNHHDNYRLLVEYPWILSNMIVESEQFLFVLWCIANYDDVYVYRLRCWKTFRRMDTSSMRPRFSYSNLHIQQILPSFKSSIHSGNYIMCFVI